MTLNAISHSDINLYAHSYPLIAFIHVPKTAGTTVNEVLHRCTPRGCDNAHLVFNNQSLFGSFARGCDWIAGHLPRDKFASGLIWLKRSVEYFASVREPIAQLSSHLNYSFERYARPDYFYSSDLEEQKIDLEVISTDFSNPVSVINFLLKNKDKYLNLQARFVLGSDFAEISEEEIQHRLSSYTCISTENNLCDLYRSFGFASLPEDASKVRKNVAKSHFDTSILRTPQLRSFLARHHQYDFKLYDWVQRLVWVAAQRNSFRPAFLAVDVFTSANFDERIYLDSNPDVANAVRDGSITSGRAHFEEYGLHERRMLRRWVFPNTSTKLSETSECFDPNAIFISSVLKGDQNAGAVSDTLDSQEPAIMPLTVGMTKEEDPFADTILPPATLLA